MPTLDKIKNRISSIKSTSKITKAMELVATAKIKKARENFDKTSSYYQEVINNVVDIADKIKRTKSKFLIKQDGKTIWIVLSSDLGLCGGYNIKNFKELKAQYKAGDAILAVGLKAQSLSRTNNIEFEQGYSQIIGSFTVDNAQNIVDDAVKLFTDKDSNFTSIKLIASQFINNVTFEPETINLIPISVDNLESTKEKIKSSAPTKFEQEPDEIVSKIAPMFMVYSLYAKVQEAKLIEQASRRLAMEAATKNAKELLDDLKIQYNQKRQANITQEISEIIAGSNS